MDWESVSDKPDWTARIWTTAAIVLIIAGFVGGMYLRTSLSGEPDYLEVPGDGSRSVHIAGQ